MYNTFRPLIRGSPSTTSVPNLSSITTNHRHNSNSSSNEADEESSLSSLNSNNVLPIIPITIEENSLSNMSTFKTINSNILPSKPSEIKRRSNNRKQIYATLNLNNNNNSSSTITENETCSSAPPPPPPPFPVNLDLKNKNENENSFKSDFQSQIEQAKTRLKKVNNESSSSPKKSHPPRKFLITFDFKIKSNVNGFILFLVNSNKIRSPSSFYPSQLKNIVIEDITPSTNGFPPPPSPTTLRRSNQTVATSPQRNSTTTMDPRLDTNFSAVIAQRAAEAKARRHENPLGLEFNSNGLPPSTTFFNNCVTTNGVHQTSTTNSK